MANKQTPSNKYWEKRRELEDKARLKMEDETIKSLTKDVLPQALLKIKETLLSQSDLHKMTQAELLADASKRDQEKYRQYIDENYQELMESDEKYQEFIDEFFPSYDYAKVNRLLQIRTDIFNVFASEMIKKDVNEKFNKGLEDILNKSYMSNSSALFQLMSAGDVTPLPKQELESILNYPWSGKTFSNRLWGNISRLEQNLSSSIVNAVASGGGVLDALADMKDNSFDLFKQEEGKFNRAIENLVRTEYAHFAVEGVKKSTSDAGIEQLQAWSAEDERVCAICGGRHGKIIKDGWYPPYHGRCRCTVIPKMPELDENIDEIYEEMFGNLLDDFANDNFGIKLTHPKIKPKIDNKKTMKGIQYNDSLAKTNMEQMVGKDNYDNFIEHLNGISNDRVKQMFNLLGDKVSFKRLSASGAYALRGEVQLNQKSFSGSDSSATFRTVYHEMGHFFDYLGIEILTGNKKFSLGKKKTKVLRKTIEVDDNVSEASGLPQYKLKEAFRRDLWELINGTDLPMREDMGPKPRKKAEKKAWEDRDFEIYLKSKENEKTFLSDYQKKYKNNPRAYGALSDMLSSTGFLDRNIGAAHDKNYWKATGIAETEFFAHATEMVADEELEKVMREVFPRGISVWEKIVDDILEKVE